MLFCDRVIESQNGQNGLLIPPRRKSLSMKWIIGTITIVVLDDGVVHSFGTSDVFVNS